MRPHKFLALALALALGPQAQAFELPSHPAVEARQERLLTSPKAQQYTERALAERAAVGPFIQAAIARRGLPPQLEAVVFVESGYQNLPAATHYPSAGTWQFITKTARTYGLQVDDTVDERMDLAKSTEAALDLLTDLHEHFGDWGLAFAAYNVGQGAVDRAIETHGTEELGALIAAEALPTYAADVLAASALLESEGLIR